MPGLTPQQNTGYSEAELAQISFSSLAAANKVTIVDSTGTPVSLSGGGTQYADGAAIATPVGNEMNWNDAGTQRAVSAAKPLPVSAAALPLPSGAATAAKQAALGTAGTPSADVISVQGVTNGTPQPIQGSVASGSADSGNPVKFGGVYNTSLPTLTSGQRSDAQVDSNGRVIVTLPTSTAVIGSVDLKDAFGNNTAVMTPGDALAAAPTSNLGVTSFQLRYNGSAWQRQRTPNVFKVVSLGAATAETTIWTPTSGKKFRLMGFILTCGAASTLTFKDNTAGTSIFASRGSTDTPISPSVMGDGILSAAANNVLTVTRGTSCTLDGVVWGTEE